MPLHPPGSPALTSQLQTELWTSWASVLRSYTSLHGLASTHHAIVEVSADLILIRVDTRTLRFTHTTLTDTHGHTQPFSLQENGTAKIGSDTEEMDLAAERLAREMMQP